MDIDPDTLNLKSQEPGSPAISNCPRGFDVGEIKVDTVMLNGEVQAQPQPTAIADYDADGIADLMVKFDRGEATLEVGDAVQITVAGKLNDGTEFEGCDMIRVIEPRGKDKK